MPLNLEDKKAIVEEVAKVASTAVSAACAEYRGLTVANMTALRTLARNNKIYLRVVRNTLAKRAVENTDFSCLKPVLTGPLILAFSPEEPGASARLFRDFAKANEKFAVKALAVGGQLYDAKDIERVASLPSRDEAISIIMSVMKAPVVKLARTLVEPHSMLVRVMAAVRDQKQGSAAA